ncbi:amidinotransferase [Streptomyces griseus]|uniref:amidinotransferase n=1 Tax=Streptomyces TaxID=1883 RepID=UPI0001C19634|nr:amidinotransferase [Streptomyces sp. ACT-1]EGE39876.1 amidinotransferase [Streptomyces sp. ACT-1]
MPVESSSVFPERVVAPFGVHREWDPLAEVVVGSPLDFTFPQQPPSRDELAFLPTQFAEMADRARGRRWSDADPEGYARCGDQLDALAGFLTGRGITVHRPDPLTEDEQAVLADFSPLSLQIFVRDPMIVIGDRVIEASLRLPHRFKERFGLRPVMAELVRRGARHTVVPPGCPVPLAEVARARGPFLEGGDVMLFGTDVLVGVGRGCFATDAGGVDWLRSELGDAYRVHAVPLHPRVLHLDDGLAAVREGLAVVAPEQFTDGLPRLLADWELVPVGLDEALDLLAANVLVLGPGEVVIDSRVPWLADALVRHDVTVHTLEFDAVTPFAGGFRCSHHPLFRRTPPA